MLLTKKVAHEPLGEFVINGSFFDKMNVNDIMYASVLFGCPLSSTDLK